ncbi:MAG: ABC-type transport auxiliary lipoprotein family protein [Rhodospirillaceae bacterium]
MNQVSRRLILSVAMSGVAAAALLSACSSDPVPRDTFYRLGPAATPAPLAGGPIKGTVEVPLFKAEGIINERAILYRESARELAQYNYHAWLEPPSVMLQRAFLEGLRSAQAFSTVAAPEMRLDRDYELIGNIREWEHVLPQGGAGPAISIAIDLGLRRVAGNQEVLIKTYRAAEPAADESVDAAVAAFTVGVDKILAQFLADLAALPKSVPPPG